MANLVPPKKPRVVKPPYVPTLTVKEALAACVAALEGLNILEKGHVISRLGDMYHLKRVKPKKEVPAAKTKEPWKQEWEKTPEFKDWQAAKLPKDAPKDDVQQAKFRDLQDAAVKKRAEIKARFPMAGQAMLAPRPDRSSPAAEQPEEEKGKKGSK